MIAHGVPATDRPSNRIEQPERQGDTAFIERAFSLRRQVKSSGDLGYGAVTVRDGKAVGQSPSRVIVNRNPTTLTEMEAIRDAARRLASRDLGNTLDSFFTSLSNVRGGCLLGRYGWFMAGARLMAAVRACVNSYAIAGSGFYGDHQYRKIADMDQFACRRPKENRT